MPRRRVRSRTASPPLHPLCREHRIDVHVDPVVVHPAVASAEQVAAGKAQLLTVEPFVVHGHHRDDGPAFHLPQIEELMADRRDRLEEGMRGFFESGYAGGHLGVAELEADVIGDAPEQRIDVTAVHGGEDFSYHPGGSRVHVGGHGHSFVGRQAAAQGSRRPARLPSLAAKRATAYGGPSRFRCSALVPSKHRTVAKAILYRYFIDLSI